MDASGPAVDARDLLNACRLPMTEGRALLCHVLGASREQLVAHPETQVGPVERLRFEQAAGRRRDGLPMAYIVGHQEFYGHRFDVGPSVLVPRPDTELLVDTALALLSDHRDARVLELGAGSGCIAISLALARPDLKIVATDRSPMALQVARANQQRLGARVQFIAADWLAPIAGRFDLIVANPPYIADGDRHLDDLAFEPIQALTSGRDGLDDLRRIGVDAPARLTAGGHLLVEHGYEQANAVRTIFEDAGLQRVRTLRDLAGQERACVGTAGRR